MPCAVCPQSRNQGQKSEISTIAELIWYNQFNGYKCRQKGEMASMNGATTIQERLKDFFCRTENRAEINTPLRELHLSDEMVALLKSGRINNLVSTIKICQTKNFAG